MSAANPSRLDTPASDFFRFRDLICGEIFRSCSADLDVTPRQPDTWRMLAGLAEHLLDRLVEEWGAIELTYGFAPPALTARIEDAARQRRRIGSPDATPRIAPRLDQHASCELNAAGLPVCERGGAAVDLRVAGCSSLELAKWCADHLPIDRLYFYEPDRPIHLSWAPRPKGECIEMRRSASGRRIPRPLDKRGRKL